MSLHAVLSCHRRNKHGIEMFDYGGKGINNIWYNKIFSQKFHLRAQKKSREGGSATFLDAGTDKIPLVL